MDTYVHLHPPTPVHTHTHTYTHVCFSGGQRRISVAAEQYYTTSHYYYYRLIFSSIRLRTGWTRGYSVTQIVRDTFVMAECEVAVGLLGEEQEELREVEVLAIGLLNMHVPLPPSFPPSLTHVYTYSLAPSSLSPRFVRLPTPLDSIPEYKVTKGTTPSSPPRRPGDQPHARPRRTPAGLSPRTNSLVE